jgi:hypothetical protein
MRELGSFGAKKFAAGGGVEEEVTNGDGGAGRAGSIFDGENFASGNFEASAGGVVGRAGDEFEAGNGGDGGERLTAEAEGGDGEKIVGGADFGGGVAFEGEEGVIADHAATVVGDADEAAATGFDFDADVGGSGVEGVLEELLNDGGGTVDDLAGGDLVSDLVGENADATHAGFKDMRFPGMENRMWRSGSVLDADAQWQDDCAGSAQGRNGDAEVQSVRLRGGEAPGGGHGCGSDIGDGRSGAGADSGMDAREDAEAEIH